MMQKRYAGYVLQEQQISQRAEVEYWLASGNLGSAEVYILPQKQRSLLLGLPTWSAFADFHIVEEEHQIIVIIPGVLQRSLQDIAQNEGVGTACCVAWHISAVFGELHESGGAHGYIHPDHIGLDSNGNLTVRPALSAFIPSEPDESASALATDCWQLSFVLRTLGISSSIDPRFSLLMSGLQQDVARLRLQPSSAIRQSLTAVMARHPEWEEEVQQTLGKQWGLDHRPATEESILPHRLERHRYSHREKRNSLDEVDLWASPFTSTVERKEEHSSGQAMLREAFRNSDSPKGIDLPVVEDFFIEEEPEPITPARIKLPQVTDRDTVQISITPLNEVSETEAGPSFPLHSITEEEDFIEEPRMRIQLQEAALPPDMPENSEVFNEEDEASSSISLAIEEPIEEEVSSTSIEEELEPEQPTAVMEELPVFESEVEDVTTKIALSIEVQRKDEADNADRTAEELLFSSESEETAKSSAVEHEEIEEIPEPVPTLELEQIAPSVDDNSIEIQDSALIEDTLPTEMSVEDTSVQQEDFTEIELHLEELNVDLEDAVHSDAPEEVKEEIEESIEEEIFLAAVPAEAEDALDSEQVEQSIDDAEEIKKPVLEDTPLEAEEGTSIDPVEDSEGSSDEPEYLIEEVIEEPVLLKEELVHDSEDLESKEESQEESILEEIVAVAIPQKFDEEIDAEEALENAEDDLEIEEAIVESPETASAQSDEIIEEKVIEEVITETPVTVPELLPFEEELEETVAIQREVSLPIVEDSDADSVEDKSSDVIEEGFIANLSEEIIPDEPEDVLDVEEPLANIRLPSIEEVRAEQEQELGEIDQLFEDANSSRDILVEDDEEPKWAGAIGVSVEYDDENALGDEKYAEAVNPFQEGDVNAVMGGPVREIEFEEKGSPWGLVLIVAVLLVFVVLYLLNPSSTVEEAPVEELPVENMTGLPMESNIQFTTNPPGGLVYIDNEPKGLEPILLTLSEEKSTYRICIDWGMNPICRKVSHQDLAKGSYTFSKDP